VLRYNNCFVDVLVPESTTCVPESTPSTPDSTPSLTPLLQVMEAGHAVLAFCSSRVQCEASAHLVAAHLPRAPPLLVAQRKEAVARAMVGADGALDSALTELMQV
jgi:hypothetical protein